jgi:hypothetical protein
MYPFNKENIGNYALLVFKVCKLLKSMQEREDEKDERRVM